MSDPSARLIDGAQFVAEIELLRHYIDDLPRGEFLALWQDARGDVCRGVGLRRAQAAIEVPEDVDDYVIYECRDDEWITVTVGGNADPNKLMAAVVADARRRHPSSPRKAS